MSLAKFLFAGLALFGIATGTIAMAEEKPVIQWMLTGVPPKFIPDGPLKGSGYGEKQVAYLARRLPQFQHRLELVTPARLWHEMQSGKGVCSIDIAKVPDRESWALFTRRSTSIPGYRILVLQDRLTEFAPFRTSDGSIDLARLVASDHLTGLYVAGRHYTTQISGLIRNQALKVSLESTSASTKIFEMIASRRGDFSFATVTEMNYFTRLNEAAPPQSKPWPALVMLPIEGGSEEVHGHIACSRDLLGRKMIETLDRLFEDEAAWNEFLAPLKPWLADVPVVRP